MGVNQKILLEQKDMLVSVKKKIKVPLDVKYVVRNIFLKFDQRRIHSLPTVVMFRIQIFTDTHYVSVVRCTMYI